MKKLNTIWKEFKINISNKSKTKPLTNEYFFLYHDSEKHQLSDEEKKYGIYINSLSGIFFCIEQLIFYRLEYFFNNDEKYIRNFFEFHMYRYLNNDNQHSKEHFLDYTRRLMKLKETNISNTAKNLNRNVDDYVAAILDGWLTWVELETKRPTYYQILNCSPYDLSEISYGLQLKGIVKKGDYKKLYRAFCQLAGHEKENYGSLIDDFKTTDKEIGLLESMHNSVKLDIVETIQKKAAKRKGN